MGIDPVTHTPRLDLLELSSLLNSTLYNPQALSYLRTNNPNNYNPLGNMGPPLLNQSLLNLASALLSNQPKIIPQNVQDQNQLDNINNYSVPQNDQFQYSQLPFLNETQFMQSKMEQLSQTYHDQSLDSSNQALIAGTENFVHPMGISNGYNHDISAQSSSSSIINSLPAENHQNLFYSANGSTIGHNNMMVPNMSFSSLLSTPSSSSTPNTYNVNSSSNTTTTHEDERDSFCSNILMYHDIANALNGNHEFM